MVAVELFVAKSADAHDRDIKHLALDLHHATDVPWGTRRSPPTFADDAVDARDDLRAVTERRGRGVELGEVADAKVHAPPL